MSLRGAKRKSCHCEARRAVAIPSVQWSQPLKTTAFVGEGFQPSLNPPKQTCPSSGASHHKPCHPRGAPATWQSPASIHRKAEVFPTFPREIATGLSALAMTRKWGSRQQRSGRVVFDALEGGLKTLPYRDIRLHRFPLCPGDCHGPVGPRNDTETGNPGKTNRQVCCRYAEGGLKTLPYRGCAL